MPATDELDHVEARQVRDAAAERLDSLEGASKGTVRRAARWLRTKGTGTTNETRYIAFERALIAYSEAADPDVVAMLWADIGLQYFSPPPPLPGTPFAFDVDLRGLVDNPDLNRDPTPEDALAGIDAYLAEVVPVVEDAAKVVTDSHHAFQQAETTGEMLAALETLNGAYTEIRLALAAAYQAHDDADIIPDDRRRWSPRLRDVYVAARAVYPTVQEAGSRPVDFSAMEDRINALALADTAGMDAFWRSLADSCQP